MNYLLLLFLAVSPSDTFRAGDRVELFRDGGAGNTLLAAEEALLPALQDKSPGGFARFVQLREDGKVTYLPNGTPALVIDSGKSASRIRILGDHQNGSVWWVEDRYIKRVEPDPKNRSLQPKIGAPALLFRSDDSAHVFVATSESNFDKMLKSYSTQGLSKFNDLLKRGHVIKLPNETPVRVLEAGLNRFRVSILAGKRKGLEAWAEAEDLVYQQGFEETIPAIPPDQLKLQERSKKAMSLWKIASNLDKSMKTDAAVRIYRQLLKEFPGTESAQLAAERLKAIGVKP